MYIFSDRHTEGTICVCVCVFKKCDPKILGSCNYDKVLRKTITKQTKTTINKI